MADIREVLYVLVEEVSKNKSSQYGHATRVLVSSYVNFMCSRGLVHESEAVLDAIYTINADGPGCIASSTVENVIKKLAYQCDGSNALKWFHRLAYVTDGKHHYNSSSLAYHHVCDAFRRGKDFDRLVSFIENPLNKSKEEEAPIDVQNNV